MSYTVCIPTAGTGSRLGDATEFLNKSLISVAQRPVLAHLMDAFPEACRFVIALGHQGMLVREFMALAYPKRDVTFVEVAPFRGPGSGLGYSLRCCAPYLQAPFTFVSCDTLVEGPIPPPDEDWVGYSPTPATKHYRRICLHEGKVGAFHEKEEPITTDHYPYIGLAGIHDVARFWQGMQDGGITAIATGEIEGLRAIHAHHPLRAHTFAWHDTGNPDALVAARAAYPGNPDCIILEKPNETIWLLDDRVIKCAADTEFIARRVARAEMLSGFIPQLIGHTPHCYAYRKAPGRPLSAVMTLPLFERLLAYAESFWSLDRLSNQQRERFHNSCMRFYRDKTSERLEAFMKLTGHADSNLPINGRPMPTLAALLEQVDWEWLVQGIPVRFHGDFHAENILWSEEQSRFTFLDWRQDFAGHSIYGDLYYDLAKLWHGLIVHHPSVMQNHYHVTWGPEAITFTLERPPILEVCETRYIDWLCSHGYDVRKTRLLTALIYLNIAALHHAPYNLLLFALGKKMLAETLENHTL